MPGQSNLWMILSVTIACIGLGLTFLFLIPENPDASEGVTEIMVADPSGTPVREVRILFAGSSYTYYHAMPAMFVAIATSDPQNQTRFVVQAVTKGGTGLDQLWAEGKVQGQIRNGKWDYVVLQDTPSVGIYRGEQLRLHFELLAKYHREITVNGAQPVLFSTWALKPGSPLYTDARSAGLINFQTMLMRIRNYIHELSTRLNAAVVPVGDAWEKTLAQQPGIELYMGDHNHPSVEGSYLTALVFYRHFSGHALSSISYKPRSVAEADAQFLRQIASQ